MRLLLPALFLLGGLFAPAAEVYLDAGFEDGAPVEGGRIVQIPGRGGVLQVDVSADSSQPRSVKIPLPIDRLRGKRVFVGADVRGENISERPKAWNGVKVMLVIESPFGTDYPQPEIPAGSFDWKRFTRRAVIPADATAATLTLGLEEVTGRVWFDNVRVTHQSAVVRAPAADPSQAIFRGHKLPRLRGAMAGRRIGEEDIKDFAKSWGGNLLRWQLFESARQDRPLDRYESWLDGELDYLDGVLEWWRLL